MKIEKVCGTAQEISVDTAPKWEFDKSWELGNLRAAGRDCDAETFIRRDRRHNTQHMRAGFTSIHESLRACGTVPSHFSRRKWDRAVMGWEHAGYAAADFLNIRSRHQGRPPRDPRTKNRCAIYRLRGSWPYCGARRKARAT
jgi:hypothetical protein